MRSGRVKHPKLPPLPQSDINPSPPVSPLQDALQSVLHGSSVASEHCSTLIQKQNCSRSLPEWNAAHTLLVLAVTDGQIDAEGPEGQLYFWRDQLYCTVSDLSITSEQDKLHVFKCLRRAQQLNLIHSADAYIQGIHVMQSVHAELFVLKKACITLFERLLVLEFSLEDLRASFEAYRQQQLYSNLISIALKLIPIAGGAAAHALVAGLEVYGELSGADVVEYALSAAQTILEEGNFSKLPRGQQAQILNVFDEFGYTTDQVQSLFSNRQNIDGTAVRPGSGAWPDLESHSSTDQRLHSPAVLEAPPVESVDATASFSHPNASNDSCSEHPIPSETEFSSNISEGSEFHQTVSVQLDFVDPKCNEEQNNHYELQTQNTLNRYDSTLAITDFAKRWAHFVLNSNDCNEHLFTIWNDCLTRFLEHESVSPKSLRTGSSSDVLILNEAASRFIKRNLEPSALKIGFAFRMAQFIHQHSQHLPIEMNNEIGHATINETADKWTRFISGSRNEDEELHARLNKCLIVVLEQESISPQSLKFGLESDICELKAAARECIESELQDDMKAGYYLKLTELMKHHL
ncbi:hypothetical protein FGB62_87g043 [Gracilaria domingensis]|nr:hypothetical protein FGB62_87g043 [Gracilaria domingensis]